jgi:anti-sigma-K factor RskA
MTHQELQDSAAAYALGTLEGDERAEFEAHLRICADCQVELESYRGVVDSLAQGALVVAPPNPAALRQRILREARSIRPVRSAPSARSRPAWLPWAAAAASVAVAAMSVVGYRAERSRTESLDAELAAARAMIAARDSTLATFLGPEVHVVSLTESSAKPSARVFWNHTRNVFIVTAFKVPPAPAGKTYQLWAMIKDKPPISMGTFNPDASGRALAVLPVSPEIQNAGFIDNCGLTLEPAGGSPQPTEQPRLVGSWRHVD